MLAAAAAAAAVVLVMSCSLVLRPGTVRCGLQQAKRLKSPLMDLFFWVEIIAVGMMRIIAIGMICYLSMRRTVGMI